MAGFVFTYEGDPIPCKRPRVTARGTFYDKNYAQYKKAFAGALRGAFLGTPLEGPLRLEAAFFRKHRTGVDIDNLVKALMDCIQEAGLLLNDSQIVALEAYKDYDKEAPRVEFMLEEVK